MKKITIILLTLFVFTSCKKYLDVIPDNIATIDHAFAMRNTAERYLFTCYSWMPQHSSFSSNPAFLSGDELWRIPTNTSQSWAIARGLQSGNNPLLNYWDGNNGGIALFDGIRDCNIFLENIDRVPDMDSLEKERWKAEVKFLKAYYHFWLLRMYGPIPIADKSLPINSDSETVRAERNSIDEVVSYIVNLIDEAAINLPDVIYNEVSELGRVTKPAALSIKAYILVTAASPLFSESNPFQENGSSSNPESVASKWNKAALACQQAIDLCHSLGFKLYEFQPQISQSKASDTTRIQMSIRNSVTERWNSEVIWADNNSLINQAGLSPRTWDPAITNAQVQGSYAPPLKIVEMFYSENGIPIDEDKVYQYSNRYNLRIAGVNERYNIKQGYTTVGLHFNRENRFYASIGFDGGIWYGQGRYNDDNNPFYIMGKAGQAASMYNALDYSVTSYWPKKLIHYQNVIEASVYSTKWYSWPVMRLANLYLLYSEALNEVNGPNDPAVHQYIDLVRKRAGLKPVEESWRLHAKLTDKPASKDGMRSIIQQERMIEFAFEGQRYWDLRRWRLAHIELSKPISGWNITEKEPQNFYKQVVIFQPQFKIRDYFWPISENERLRNDKIKQNPGW